MGEDGDCRPVAIAEEGDGAGDGAIGAEDGEAVGGDTPEMAWGEELTASAEAREDYLGEVGDTGVTANPGEVPIAAEDGGAGHGVGAGGSNDDGIGAEGMAEGDEFGIARDAGEDIAAGRAIDLLWGSVIGAEREEVVLGVIGLRLDDNATVAVDGAMAGEGRKRDDAFQGSGGLGGEGDASEVVVAADTEGGFSVRGNGAEEDSATTPLSGEGGLCGVEAALPEGIEVDALGELGLEKDRLAVGGPKGVGDDEFGSKVAGLPAARGLDEPSILSDANGVRAIIGGGKEEPAAIRGVLGQVATRGKGANGPGRAIELEDAFGMAIGVESDEAAVVGDGGVLILEWIGKEALGGGAIGAAEPDIPFRGGSITT